MTLERDLTQDLREQLGFLSASMRLYDEGVESESKRIATVLRVLLYDRGGTPLMKALRAREEIPWLSISAPFHASNMLSTNALIASTVAYDDGERVVKYVPMGLDSPYRRLISFDRWWRSDPIIHTPSTGLTFARSDLVAMAANRDGGAHVGRLRPQELLVATNQATPWSYGSDEVGWTAFEGSPVPASLRAVATEVIQSIGRASEMLGVSDGFLTFPRGG